MYTLESDLCEDFITTARADGWACYPEQNGWDLIIVKDGIQVGIQAKLKDNMHVIHQTIEHCVPWGGVGIRAPKVGVHIRAVLVPTASMMFRDVCRAMKIMVFDSVDGISTMPTPKRMKDYMWEVEQPMWLPEVALISKAGVASPMTMSKWRQNALKLYNFVCDKGEVTSADAKQFGINLSHFVQMHQLQSSGRKRGKLTIYVPTWKWKYVAKGYEKEAAALAAGQVRGDVPDEVGKEVKDVTEPDNG